MSFPKYPAYKDSGVEWLGEVPEHWSVMAIKRVCAVVGGSTPKSDQDAYWDGDITSVTPADLSRLTGFEIHDSMRTITAEGLESCGTTIVPEGSVILSTRAPIGSLGIAAKALCTNQGCKALVPNGPSSRLLAYLLTASNEALNVRGKGTTFLELSGDELGAFVVPLASVPEQTAIASFLDHETAKIDALVVEQQKLIDLLQEKRQAVISHAVTKGLNPNAPMKDSGVEWLGEVPAHWEIKRIKHLVATLEQGWSPQCEAFPVQSDEEWGVLKVGCVNGGIFRPEENKALPSELEPIPNLGLTAGDLLISRANTKELVGSAAVVLEDHPRLMLCDKLYRLRFQIGTCEPEFLAFYLGTARVRGQIELAATGASSSMLNIGQSTILELPRLRLFMSNWTLSLQAISPFREFDYFGSNHGLDPGRQQASLSRSA